jgi:glycerol-3-phosphate dehydrogenase
MRGVIDDLSGREFDILVVGGGAAGAAAAREACLRGFRTALIEREDFGGATSAHCFKVVHGGIRYLQHADLKRMRASCRERAIFLRIAPHLVAPLSFAVPTFGRGKGSKWFLGTGMRVYDTLTRDCNAHVLDPARRIRACRFLGRQEVLRLFPQIDTDGLTGAAVFEDGQMYNPPRLVLAFVLAAQELGATVANHAEAECFLFDGARVVGVAARDRLSGAPFEIRARMVINAAGPWAEGLLRPADKTGVPPGTYSRDACLVVARRPGSDLALALQGRTKDADALLARSARHLFLVPWRQSTLVGVWHSVVARNPDAVNLSRQELREFIAEINASCPALGLDESEVTLVGFGLVPFGDAARQGGGALSFGKQSRLIDHRRDSGIAGLISLISVRYTVARMDAAAALELAGEQLERRAGGAASSLQALPGGDIESFSAFLADFSRARPHWLPASACEALARNYGSRATAILALGEREPTLQRCLPDSEVTHAEVVHAVREEMAQRMVDVVFRRTDLGTAGHPGERALDDLQVLLQRELAWSVQRTAEERAAVMSHLNRYHGSNAPSSAKPRAA